MDISAEYLGKMIGYAVTCLEDVWLTIITFRENFTNISEKIFEVKQNLWSKPYNFVIFFVRHSYSNTYDSAIDEKKQEKYPFFRQEAATQGRGKDRFMKFWKKADFRRMS
ncbi:MAG: hypothetical protein KC684_03735 [Candidatus Omnitrophica bacterium]|nr:hypothetical protein [Candidatus Omnitrophota bacterium]